MPLQREITFGPKGTTDTAGLLGPTPDGKPPEQSRPPSKLPIGDYTEKLLASVGVTPEKYTAAKEALGMAPTCNCSKRKAWLNKAGDWLAEQLGG